MENTTVHSIKSRQICQRDSRSGALGLQIDDWIPGVHLKLSTKKTPRSRPENGYDAIPRRLAQGNSDRRQESQKNLEAKAMPRPSDPSSISRAEAPSAVRIPALDGLRGIAIALVLVYHFTILRASDVPLDRAWIFAARIGWCGVDLFFVLSGFLITGILLQSVGTRGYLLSFYARRVLRIFPLYYALVAFSLVLLPRWDEAAFDSIGDVGDDALLYWTYLSNFALAKAGEFRHGILDVSWSLSIEEQFYVLWPFVILLLRRRLAWICSGTILAALVLRLVLVWKEQHPVAIYAITPTRIDALALGSLLAVLIRSPNGSSRLIGTARTVLPSAALGVILIAGFWGTDPYGKAMQCVGYTLLGLIFSSALVLALPGSRASTWQKILEHRILRELGKYSYAIYLFHLPIRSFLRSLLGGPDKIPFFFGSQLPGLLAFALVSLVLTFVLAWISWHLFEKRFLALKRFFPTPLSRPASRPEADPR